MYAYEFLAKVSADEAFASDMDSLKNSHTAIPRSPGTARSENVPGRCTAVKNA